MTMNNKFIAIICCICTMAVTAGAYPGPRPHFGGSHGHYHHHHYHGGYNSGYNDGVGDCIGMMGTALAVGACMSAMRCSIDAPAPTPKKIIAPATLPPAQAPVIADVSRTESAPKLISGEKQRKNTEKIAKNDQKKKRAAKIGMGRRS